VTLRGSTWRYGVWFGVVAISAWLGGAACNSKDDNASPSRGGASSGAGGVGGAGAAGKPAQGGARDDSTPGGADADAGGDSSDGGGRSGSAGSGTTTPSERAKRDACMKYLIAGCTRLAECNGSRAQLSSCVHKLLPCPEFLFADGSTRSFDALAACTEEHRHMSCALLPDGPSCATPGTRPPGAPCAFGTQCSSTTCRAEEGQCGVCATPAVTGDSCVDPNVECPSTDVCLDGICVRAKARDPEPKLLGVGRDCTETEQCLFGLICDGGQQFASRGTCQPLPQVGDLCRYEPGMEHPSCAGVCDSTNTCARFPTLGEPCEMTYGCDADSICGTESDGTRCRARGKLGELCTTSAENDGIWGHGTCGTEFYCGDCVTFDQGCRCVSIYEFNRPAPACVN